MQYPQRSGEGAGYPGAGVTEVVNFLVGAENRTWVP